MKKSLLIAIFAVALAAVPAMASVQNVKVSGDINSTWLVRNNFDLGSGNGYHQNLGITQTRLRVDSDLTDNVSATVGLVNERAWGNFTSSSNSGDAVEINLAYVTMRQMLYSPLTVTVGRQNFAFGNSFIIDSAGPNYSASAGGLQNVAGDLTETTAQDAVRFTLDYNPLTIDVIYSKISNGSTSYTYNNEGNYRAKDDDLVGTNLNYKLNDKWATVVEGYLWYDEYLPKAKAAGQKKNTIVLPGIHVSTNPVKGLNLQGELAFQFGNDSWATGVQNKTRDAWATQEIVSYMLPFNGIAKYKPVLTGVYTFASGDKNTSNDNYTAWNPMYENQGGGTIYNALFPLSGMNVVALSAQADPMKDVTTKVSYTNLWLADKLNTTSFDLYQPDGTTATTSVSAKNRNIGQEVDVNLNYNYTEDVSMGLTAGWFFPGKMFTSSNNSTATQVLGNVAVSF